MRYQPGPFLDHAPRLRKQHLRNSRAGCLDIQRSNATSSGLLYTGRLATYSDVDADPGDHLEEVEQHSRRERIYSQSQKNYPCLETVP